MTNSTNSRWIDNVIFGLSVFLIFCLIFESYLALPVLVGWLGQWHPVLLHFPIVLVLIAIFLGLRGKPVPRALLTLATLSALITAITGFFLGSAGASKGDLLFWHQWLGAATALLAALWYALYRADLATKAYTKVLQLVLALCIMVTGHYGGMVTHGEGFLALPKSKTREAIPDNPLVYDDLVSRIFDDACVKCHNPNKQKGELLMTSYSQLMKGGESGAVILPSNAEESELLQRIHLPVANEEHMPPEGERALTDIEVQIIERWIALGASDTLMLHHLDANEPLVALVDQYRQSDVMPTWAELPAIADTTIARLSSDYLTIKRVASNTNALSVNMYRAPEYDNGLLIKLRPIAENIIEMDVSGLPIGMDEMALFAACSNLERLEIDQTPITDLETDTLKVLSKLNTLKLYDTKTGDATLEVIAKLSELKQLYLWKTDVSSEALQQLRTKRPALHINTGIDPEVHALFKQKDSVTEN